MLIPRSGLLPLLAVLVLILLLPGCAAKKSNAEPRVTVKGQYDTSIGSVRT